MNDYYEPHSSFRLTRPIVLGGQLGCGARLVGRMLCARTGLPFVEVDRQIEHEAGQSLARFAETHGTKRIAYRARAVLERLATQRPFPVIALDRAWPGADTAPLLRKQFDFVHIERPTHYLLDRIEKELHAAGSWLLGDQPLVLRNESDLAPLLDERAPLFGEARILLDAGERHELQVAEELRSALESVTNAQEL